MSTGPPKEENLPVSAGSSISSTPQVAMPPMAWPAMPMPTPGSAPTDPAMFLQMQQQIAYQMQMLQMMQQQMMMASGQPMPFFPMGQVPTPTPTNPAAAAPSTAPATATSSAVQPAATEAPKAEPAPVAHPTTTPATLPTPAPTQPAKQEQTPSTDATQKPSTENIKTAKGTKAEAKGSTSTTNPQASASASKQPASGKFCEFCEHYSHTIDECWYRQRKLKMMLKEEHLAQPAGNSSKATNEPPAPPAATKSKTAAPKRARSPEAPASRGTKGTARGRSPSYSDSYTDDSDYSYYSDDSYESDRGNGARASGEKRSAVFGPFDGIVVEIGSVHPAVVSASIRKRKQRPIYLRRLFDHIVRQSWYLWRPHAAINKLSGGVCHGQRLFIPGQLYPKERKVHLSTEDWHKEADRWMNRTVAIILLIASRQGVDSTTDPTYRACLGVVIDNLNAMSPLEGETLEAFWNRLYAKSAADLKISLVPPNGKKSYVSATKVDSAALRAVIEKGGTMPSDRYRNMRDAGAPRKRPPRGEGRRERRR